MPEFFATKGEDPRKGPRAKTASDSRVRLNGRRSVNGRPVSELSAPPATPILWEVAGPWYDAPDAADEIECWVIVVEAQTAHEAWSRSNLPGCPSFGACLVTRAK